MFAMESTQQVLIRRYRPITIAKYPGAAPVLTITCGRTRTMQYSTLRNSLINLSFSHWVASGIENTRPSTSNSSRPFLLVTVTQVTLEPSNAGASRVSWIQ